MFRCLVKVLPLPAATTLLSIKVRVLLRTVNALLLLRVIDLMVVAEDAFFSFVVKVFRNVTSDTGVTVPESALSALTSTIDEGSTTLTMTTVLYGVIPEHVVRTNIASGTIEMRVFLRTIDTVFEFDIIDLVFRTRFAFQVRVVEVERMKTFDALITIVVVQRIFAFTLLFDLIVSSTVVAVLALIRNIIVDLIFTTFSALLPVEERLRLGTENTFFHHRTVEFGIGAALALFCIVVKVFRKETFYAFISSPKRRSIRTNAPLLFVIEFLTSFTLLTAFLGYVEVLFIRARSACFPVKDGFILGAALTGLSPRVIDKVFRTRSTLFVLKVKVFRQIAGNTFAVSLEGLVFGAFTLSVFLAENFVFRAALAYLFFGIKVGQSVTSYAFGSIDLIRILFFADASTLFLIKCCSFETVFALFFSPVPVFFSRTDIAVFAVEVRVRLLALLAFVSADVKDFLIGTSFAFVLVWVKVGRMVTDDAAGRFRAIRIITFHFIA